jgi:lysophospholipase L1-like esterase
LIFSLSILALGIVPLPAQTIGPQAGQKVAFMGDSITQNGMLPGGYILLVAEAMKDAGRPIVVIPAGVSGNMSRDMLARLDRDVLSKKPDWMTLSCGVNDVWAAEKGVPLDKFELNITTIVDSATRAGIKVVILTATMIYENPQWITNVRLAPYNDFLRALAAQRHLPLADLNADMQAELQRLWSAPHKPGNLLTIDGAHMNALGNEMMAAGVLKAFGFTDAQLEQARREWHHQPAAAPTGKP